MIPKTENMTDWFKRKPSGVSASNVYLAAFGKHPGWEDHMPGIGVDTEALAGLKQSLYLDGIRGQIDSGAWEKMEQIKRMEGFDHSFLWLRPGLTLLGVMWSSTDRIGRAKYPMILCAEGDGISPGFTQACAKPELERLRDTCKSLASAEDVTAECRSAQGRLRGTFERAQDGWVEPFSNIAERQQFLDCAELSPNREGFLRILHEYSTEQGSASAQKAKHLRVPVISSLPTDAFTPWVEFFRCLVPPKFPVLFIKRHDGTWLDVVIGEPVSADFFCLQAATDALPLTTQVPYEISSATRAALETVSSRLGVPSATAKQSRRQAPQIPIAPQGVPVASKGGGRSMLVIGILVVVVLAGVAMFLFLKFKGVPPKTVPPASHSAPAPAVSPIAAEGKKYETAIQAATDAFAKGDYDEAIQQANIALGAEPGDQAATQIKTDATNKKRDVATQADAKTRQAQYAAAMARARQALANKDYSEVNRQTAIALTYEAGDNDAKALMQQAQNAQSDQQRMQEYAAAMQGARQEFDRKNYAEAIQNANDALTARPGDADAAALKSNAQTAQSAEAAYQTAMQAAQRAFDSKNYDIAAQQATLALTARPGDAAAATLRDNSTSAGDTQKKSLQNQSDVSAIQDAWNKNDFNAVIQHADLALQASPDQPDIKAKLRDSVYNQLEIYAVWFGVIKPENASLVLAKKATPLAQGDMAPSTANAYKNQIDGWMKLLNRYQLADDAHTKLAGSIEQNINRY